MNPMKDLLQKLSTINPEACNELKKIFKNLYDFSEGISSAVKFIDFFVHDMLDYAVLQKDS